MQETATIVPKGIALKRIHICEEADPAGLEERKRGTGGSVLGMRCRPGGMIVNGNEVDEEGGAADEGGEEEGRHQHLSDPDLVQQHCHIRDTCQSWCA